MPSPQEKERIFVYGTLRKGSNHEMYHLLARNAHFIGDAKFRGKLYFADEYPAAIPSDKRSDAVKGEVYELRNPAAVLQVLDKYEGCGHDDSAPHEFARRKVTVTLNAGDRIPAWIYIYEYPTEGLKPIESGDYMECSRG